MDCIFCKIIDKEISSNVIYEDEKLIVINDINPQAPVHFLIMPKEHIPSNEDITDSNSSIVGYIFSIANKIAKEYGLSERTIARYLRVEKYPKELLSKLENMCATISDYTWLPS